MLLVLTMFLLCFPAVGVGWQDEETPMEKRTDHKPGSNQAASCPASSIAKVRRPPHNKQGRNCPTAARVRARWPSDVERL